MLFQSAKMASIGVLSAGIAHEINNPISFVKSNLQLMEDYLEDIGIILIEYDKLHNIINDGEKVRTI